MLTAPDLQQHVDRVLQRSPAAFIVDLSGLDFLGSAGIGVLVDVSNRADSLSYAVVANGPATLRPLQLLAIDQIIDIYPTMTDATSALGIAAAETG